MTSDHTNTREFQRLALEMLFGLFEAVPDVVVPASADGPSFTRLEHHLAPGMGESHTSIVDTHLVPLSTSLSLGQVASSLIVAFNTSAQSVYVVSNGPLDEEALAKAAQFKRDTNMRVHLIDGITLASWVQTHRSTLEGYPPELLDTLAQAARRHEGPRILTASPRGFSARVELGWHSSEQMATCEVLLSELPLAEPPPLIGESRVQITQHLARRLDAQSGTTVIVGAAGIGKSTILLHVADHLRRQGISVGTLSLDAGTTSRSLFLETLATLAGLDLSTLLLAARQPNRLESLLAQVGGLAPHPQMREAVTSVFMARLEDYASHRDLNDRLLIEYLVAAVSPHVGRRRRALFFQELNQAPRETLEFLHALGSQLGEIGLSILYEVRDETGDARGGYTTDDLLKLLEQGPSCRTVRLSAPTNDEARRWIAEQLPGFGLERAEVVRARVGNSPLFLSVAIDWMLAENVVRRQDAEHVLIEDLERFFEGISPPTCAVVLDRLIASMRRHPDRRMRQCITALGLLDGELNREVLQHLCGDGNPMELVESLLATSLFAEGSTAWAVAASHGLVLERIRLGTSRIEGAHVATQLLGWLESIQPDPWVRKRWRVKLLAAMDAWEAVVPEARDVARELFRQRQWALSIQMYQLALTGLQRRPWSIETERVLAETGVEILEAESQRYRLGTPQCLRLLESTRTTIELAGSGGDTVWREIVLRARLVDWRSSLVREDLDEALERGRSVMKMAMEEHGLDPELCGQAVCCLGIALKALGRTADSHKVFDEGVARFPASTSAVAGRLSNLAATCLDTAPEQALGHIEELLTFVEGRPFPFSDYLHARVDRSMMAFLCRRYDFAMELALDGIRLSLANAIPAQEARARNILGCCRWVEGNVEQALAEFDRASFASERSVSYRFLWRMRTNCALAALEAGKLGQARAFASSALGMLVEPRRRVLAALEDRAGHETSRWYVALLALGTCCHHLGDEASLRYLRSALPDPRFERQLQQRVAGHWPAEVFNNTSHVHAGRIMMTG